MSTNKERTNPQQWLDYLDGKLPPEEMARLEEEIGQSEFLRDALEGLRPIHGKEDLSKVVRGINRGLRKQLASRERRRGLALPGQQQWVLITILVLLGVCLLGYYLYVRLK
jgi:hypothetical protein